MITSHNDLSVSENVQSARMELDRATTDADYALWARKWGDAACDELLSPSSREEALSYEAQFNDASDEIDDLQGELDDLKRAVEDAIGALKSAL